MQRSSPFAITRNTSSAGSLRSLKTMGHRARRQTGHQMGHRFYPQPTVTVRQFALTLKSMGHQMGHRMGHQAGQIRRHLKNKERESDAGASASSRQKGIQRPAYS